MNPLSAEKKNRRFESYTHTADRSNVWRMSRSTRIDTHSAVGLSAENAAPYLGGRRYTSESLTKKYNGAVISILRISRNAVRNQFGKIALNNPS